MKKKTTAELQALADGAPAAQALRQIKRVKTVLNRYACELADGDWADAEAALSEIAAIVGCDAAREVAPEW